MNSPQKNGRWKNLLVLSFGNTVDNADGGLVSALYPIIKDSLKMNNMGLGIFTSVSRFSRMIFGPLWAMAADRWNRKALLFLVTGVWGIWTLLAGFSADANQLLLFYTIASIGTVASEPLVNAITSDLFPNSERGKGFGWLRGLSALGLLMFFPVVAWFSTNPEGWRWAMFLLGGLSVLSGILVLLFFEDPGRGASEAAGHGVSEAAGHGVSEAAGHGVSKDAEESAARFRWSDVALLMKNKTVVLLSISLLMVTTLVMQSFSAAFLHDVRHFSNEQAIWIMGFFAVGFIVSSVFSGLLGDWAERRLPGKGRIVLMQAYLAVYAIASFVCLQIEWPKDAYYALFFVFGLVSAIGFSGVVPPMISAVVLPELRGSAFGFLFSFVQGGLAAILSLVVGALADRYGFLPVVFWVTTVPYAANALFWFVFYKVYPRDAASMENTLRTRAGLT